jgi:FkbM family methyltransferase
MNPEHIAAQLALRAWPFPRGAGRIIDRYFKDLKVDGETTIVRTTDGFMITVKPNDLIGRHLYLTGEFDRSIVELLLGLAKPGDVLLDVGANIGYVSACFLNSVPGSFVVAVEPQDTVVNLLQKNLATFGRHTVVPVAVSDRDGIGSLKECEDNPGAGRLVADDTDLAKRVELWTGDHLFAVANIDRLDLVKIDVEGHEDAVFATCAGQFKKLRPRAIVFECTSGSCAPEGKIGALLNSIDYAVFGVRKRLTKLDLVPIKSASDCIFNDYVAMRK